MEPQNATESTHGEQVPSQLDGLAFEFAETMAGFYTLGETDFRRGYEQGRAGDHAVRFDVEVHAENLGLFLRRKDHTAALTGTVTLAPFGGPFAIRDGVFNLFNLDAKCGVRRMVYSFRFTARDGQTYFLQGHKEVHDDRDALDPLHDITTLFTSIYRGSDDQAPCLGAGILRFDIRDAAALVGSMKVLHAKSRWQRAVAFAAFTSFAWGVLRDEYLADSRLLYDTEYENLVLSGVVKEAEVDGEKAFFLVSGVHERGFPWGDTGSVWDLLLVVADGQGGYDRYCITDLALEGLRLDLSTGSYRYVGPIFGLPDDRPTSFSGMRKKDARLYEGHADIELNFDAHARDAVAIHFPLVPALVRKLTSKLYRELREVLPGEHPLGIFVTPHQIRVRGGSLRIEVSTGAGTTRTRVLNIDAERTSGEAELGTFRNLKEPTLLYGYLCAIRPEDGSARVQIHSRTLRDEKEHWGKDRLDAFLGSVVSRTSSSEFSLQHDTLEVRGLAPAGLPGNRAPKLERLGAPILDVRNDQFPTGVFHRRIVEVVDPNGATCLALEEDMTLLRLEAVGSNRRVTVASIRDADRFIALDRVLYATGFDDDIDRKCAAANKPRDAFLVCIKPNFMFAYDKRDRSTYTDPELVAHLVRRLREMGYRRIKVVEAQSTYGEYFDRRSVREMAEYLGYEGSAGYEVVDMTLDAATSQHLGPCLGLHPVSVTWRDADYRIAFAKNKTHAYAFYSLTLKCVYGALPLANKFEEYHCRRGIARSGVEYLEAFPVDFGLIDCFSSADGPFGVFASPIPRETNTIIGGADLVAVDWVGASKMGIDPMISSFMRLAVGALGKPEILFIGDGAAYRPWLNVPTALTLFTNGGVDASHYFGNLMYAAAAQMDETHFTHKSRSVAMRWLRRLTLPLRRTFFLRTGENPTWTNRLVSWLIYRLGF